MVVGWATTGEINGTPIAALVATRGNIITGYTDNLPVDDPELDAFGPPLKHHEPSETQIRAALLARLRKVNKAPWLLVHDADEVESWLQQGFRLIESPADVPADEAVLVLAWGELPEDAAALLRARGLSWGLRVHRSAQA